MSTWTGVEVDAASHLAGLAQAVSASSPRPGRCCAAKREPAPAAQCRKKSRSADAKSVADVASDDEDARPVRPPSPGPPLPRLPLAAAQKDANLCGCTSGCGCRSGAGAVGGCQCRPVCLCSSDSLAPTLLPPRPRPGPLTSSHGCGSVAASVVQQVTLSNAGTATEKSAVTVCQWNGCGTDFADAPEALYDHVNIHVDTLQSAVGHAAATAAQALTGSTQSKRTKRFPCLWAGCSKWFIQRTDLKVHLRSHTGEKPFACKVCNKRFSTKHQVRLHNDLVHKDERKWACKLCDKRYASSTHLKTHMLSHNTSPEERKPFKCPHCQKRYSRADSLRAHLVVHEINSKPFKCGGCQTGFTLAKDCRRHMSSCPKVPNVAQKAV